ncbi:MAG: hypothetical protein ACQESG_00460 [Nanobdellota archaeon]
MKLVYGFRPFLHYPENITEGILRRLRGKDIATVAFDVRFNKRQFIDEVRRVDPEVIVGLGQYPRGKKLRIERKAVNAKRLRKGDEAQPILKGPPAYFLTWRVQPDGRSWRSYDASDYVCNYFLYIISHYFNNKKLASIHIPVGYDIGAATRYVRELLG